MPTPVLCPNPLCRHLLCERDGGVYVMRVRVRVRKRDALPRIVRGRFDEIACDRCGEVWKAERQAA